MPRSARTKASFLENDRVPSGHLVKNGESIVGVGIVGIEFDRAIGRRTAQLGPILRRVYRVLLRLDATEGQPRPTERVIRIDFDGALQAGARLSMTVRREGFIEPVGEQNALVGFEAVRRFATDGALNAGIEQGGVG